METSNTEDVVDKHMKLSTLITRLIKQDESSVDIKANNISETTLADSNALKTVDQSSVERKKVNKICRLCLIESKSASFDVDSVIGSMMEYILPDVKLSISSDPLVCAECYKILNSSFKFRNLCQDTELTIKNISDKVKNNDLVDLKTCWDTRSAQTICRICLKISEENDCVKLYSSEDDPLKNMVEKCLPNVNTQLTKEPMMCSCCLEHLEELFNFMMLCLDTEEKINYYCEEKTKQSDVDLYKVFLFSQCIDDEEGGNFSQIEGDEDHVIMEETQVSHISTNSLTSENEDTAGTHRKRNYISFVDFPENDPFEVENGDVNLEIDPLGDGSTNHLVVKQENDSLDHNKSQIQEQTLQNAEDDDFFEEENIPRKRSRLETENEAPYPINIIEAIPLQFLESVTLENLSDIPVLDARMNGITPFLSKITPQKNEKDKDILAQLMDEINAPDTIEIDCEEDNVNSSEIDSVQSNSEDNATNVRQVDSNYNFQNQENSSLEKNLIEDNMGCDTIGKIKDLVPSNKVKKKRKKTVDTPLTDKECLNIDCGKEIGKLETENNIEGSCDLSVPKKNSGSEKCPFKPKPLPSRPWLRCNKCTFKTKNVVSLQQHEGAHLFKNPNNGVTSNGTFRCSHCSFETKFSENLDLHINIHKFMKVYKCDKSGCNFKTKFSICFARHKGNHEKRENIGKKQICCRKCDFTTDSIDRFHVHEKSHARKKYECEICEFSTGFKGTYKIHQRLHTEEIFRTRSSARKQVKNVSYEEPP